MQIFKTRDRPIYEKCPQDNSQMEKRAACRIIHTVQFPFAWNECVFVHTNYV